MSSVPTPSTSFLSQISPLSLAGAGVGAAFGVAESLAGNRAARSAGKKTMRRLNTHINRIRANKVFDADRLSRAAQSEFGAALNIIPAENIAAVRAIALRMASGVAIDHFAILEDADRQELATQQEKENVAAQVNSQTTSPLLAGAAGAFQGATAAIGLETGLANLSAAKTAAKGALTSAAFQSNIQGLRQRILAIQLQRLRANSAFLNQPQQFLMGQFMNTAAGHRGSLGQFRKSVTTRFGSQF